MIQAIAIDDEPPALRIIEHFAAGIEGLKLLRTFTNPSDALHLMGVEPVDLLFLDIQMPSISGLDFYTSLPVQPMVIFTTAYSEYAVEGFNLRAVDYLLKPFTQERFEQAMIRAFATQDYRAKQAAQEPQYISIRADYSTHRIAHNDIRYIEGLDDYLKIHLDSGRPIVARMTMKAMVEALPSAVFMRVHRSYIIPLQRITMVRNKIIHIGEAQIPIGGSYEDAFFKAFV